MRRRLSLLSLATAALACGTEDQGVTTVSIPDAGASGAAGSSGAPIAGRGGAGAGTTSAGAAGKASAGAAGGGSAGSAGGASGSATAGTSAGTGGTAGATAGASTSGAAGAPYVPPPLPDVPDASPPACAAAMGSALQFLDDACDAKTYPSAQDRDLACPIADASPTMQLASGATVTYVPAGAPVSVDAQALVGVVPPNVRVTAILVRRVGGVPHYRYLSNGSHFDAFQPWSSSKFMAVANAAGTLRQKSAYAVGLTGSVMGTPLGDLITSIHNYDDAPYSSNGLARWFHDVGGRAKADDLLHGWLGRPASETFGGNYGQPAPALGYTITEPGGASLTVTPDATSGPANHFSTFTAAEFLKRLVHHRENATERLADVQWADLRILFYGAIGSAKGKWGGMSADTTVFLQQYDMAYLEARSHGRWLNFAKLGFGNGEIVHTGYACYPELDPGGAPVPERGRELFVATQIESGGTGTGSALFHSRDRILADAYRAVLKRVMAGDL